MMQFFITLFELPGVKYEVYIMEGVDGVGNLNEGHPLQAFAAATNEEEDYFESDEFVEIIVTMGVSQLLFQYTMARVLEISTTDVIIEAMDLYS